MNALRDRFQSLDEARPPDVWSESLARAASRRTSGAESPGWLSQIVPITLAAAALVAAVAIGLAVLRAENVGESPTGPTPMPTAEPTATVSSTAVDPQLGPDPVTAARMAVINRHVNATNAQDRDAFVDVFHTDGVFTPGADFAGTTSLFANSLAVSDTRRVDAWMAINRAWRFEAEVIRCNQDPDASIIYGYGEGNGDPMVVRCEVATRWHRLALEITQRWSYEFHGDLLGHWSFGLLDLNPPERALALTYDGLLRWEAFLRLSDPETAARYLNPRGEGTPCMGCTDFANSLAANDPARAARLAPLLTPVESGWTIDGYRFTPHGLIPYNPVLAGDIEASIESYLAEVQP